MSEPTKPGQKCRVIGGRSTFNGEGASPNLGKTVTTMFLHDERAGIEQEPVWHCQCGADDVLTTYYGAGREADFLQCWLEVIDEPSTDTTLTKEKELTE